MKEQINKGQIKDKWVLISIAKFFWMVKDWSFSSSFLKQDVWSL